MDVDELSPEERRWVLHADALRREARAIVANHPDCDAGDVYHALRNLELSPAERLRQGPTRVRRRISLTPAEHAFFEALEDLAIPYLVVGMSAALLQGAPVVTQDIDVWFGRDAPWNLIGDAARRAGGFYVAGIGLQEPTLGGPGLERIVLNASGLPSFDDEYRRAETYEVQGLHLRVLPLERILVSKRAAGREKDRLVLAGLEATLRARQSRERGGPER